jgi:hypothetical protein
MVRKCLDFGPFGAMGALCHPAAPGMVTVVTGKTLIADRQAVFACGVGELINLLVRK